MFCPLSIVSCSDLPCERRAVTCAVLCACPSSVVPGYGFEFCPSVPDCFFAFWPSSVVSGCCFELFPVSSCFVPEMTRVTRAL